MPTSANRRAPRRAREPNAAACRSALQRAGQKRTSLYQLCWTEGECRPFLSLPGALSRATATHAGTLTPSAGHCGQSGRAWSEMRKARSPCSFT
jgi:hypothetical protein